MRPASATTARIDYRHRYKYVYNDMPKGGRTKRQRQEIADERARREQAEHEAATLRYQLQRRNAHNPTPMFRASTLQWDWTCECGYYVFAGKRMCPKCLKSRHCGETVPGCARGILQAGQAATTAITAQQRVPRREPPLVVQQPGPLQAPTRRVVQPPRHATATAVQLAGSKTGGGGHAPPPTQTKTHAPTTQTPQEKIESGSKQPQMAVSVNQLLAEDEEGQLDEDQDVEVEDTEPERALNEPWAIQNKLRNLERGRQRKQVRLEKEEKAIQEQKEVIAAQQAKLVELQANADSIAEHMRSIDVAIQEKSLLLTKATAERASDANNSAAKPAANPAPEHQSDKAKEARDCLLSALVGVQTYKDQPPELQALLSQFIGVIEAMQRAELDRSAAVQAGQTTLQQAFARCTVPPASSPATGSTACFEIHSGEATPAESAAILANTQPEEAANMWIDAKVAQKRKIESVSSSTQQVEAPREMQHTAQASAERRSQPNLGTPLAPLAPTAAQYKPMSREDLLADLRSQVDKDAIRAAKKERDLQHSRSSPY